jgi:hypothetical protein
VSAAPDRHLVLPVCRAAELDQAQAEQRWLVRSLWGRSAVGLIAGHPKIGKSWMGLELAVSVASGTPCLGRFEVEQPGKALVYLAEDSLPAVRSRIEALCSQRQVDIQALDLDVITAERLQLQIDSHAEALWQVVEQVRPRLLLLDPLVRLHRFNEDRSYEMAGLLSYFRDLQRAFDVAVILVHHAGKKQQPHPGQSLRGTGDLWAWTDSALYMTRSKDHVLLATEHRSAPAIAPLPLRLCPHADGSGAHLELLDESATSAGAAEPTLAERVLQTLRGEQAPVPRVALRERLGVNNKRLGDVLAELERKGDLRRTPAGWASPAAAAAAAAAAEPAAAEPEPVGPKSRRQRRKAPTTVPTAAGAQYTLL